MNFNVEDLKLKAMGGKTLLIKMKKSITASDLLDTETKTQQAHHDIGSGSHKLLYPNRTEVKTLQEFNEAFTLYKYKQEYSKPTVK